ncbi:MAG: Gfo/Idh/MocA family protein [Armatimonadota bacterium]
MQKIAIVGAGGLGGVHGRAFAKMPNAEPVAVMDVNKEAAERLASSLGVPAFTNFDEMLAATSPDAVSVCTPTPIHAEYAVRAADAGKHVVVEKPMARTMDQCRAMVDAAERTGVVMMVAHVLRYFPEFAAAKAQVDAGAIGNPAVVRTTRGGGAPGGWFANHEISGGAILDLIIHDFDWLRWTFGDAERVYAKGLTGRNIGNLDYALVTIRFKSGMIAHVEGNWAYSAKGWTTKFEIAGDGGMLEYSNHNIPTVTIAPKDGTVSSESPINEDPYYLELKHFVDCIENGTKPSITPEDGLRAVEISLAAIESIKTGMPVQVGG